MIKNICFFLVTVQRESRGMVNIQLMAALLISWSGWTCVPAQYSIETLFSSCLEKFWKGKLISARVTGGLVMRE
jgi:hypothetical protein